jgi:hypothetical protein
VNLEHIVTGEQKRTLMSVRRTVTEPKTALAGGKLEIFTGFKAPMAPSNAEMAPSRPLGRWDSVSMVVVAKEPCGVKAARKVPNHDRDERQFCHATPRAHSPIRRKELYLRWWR